MRFDYWTIQARPDPGRLLTYGVGVVVMDPRRRDVRVEIVNRAEALPAAGDRDAVLVAAKSVAQSFNELAGDAEGLEFPGTDTPAALIDRMVSHWTGFLTVDRPRAVSARTIDEAAQLMFELYIGEEPAERQRRRITVLRNEVQKAYESRPAVREAMRRKQELTVGAVSGPLDLAVVGRDDKVLELNTSFTFQQRDPRQAQRRAENWLYRIARLRDRGGILRPQGSDQDGIVLGRDAPVVVTYDSAENDAQREVISNVHEQWEDLGIRAVPANDVAAHTDVLEQQLTAA